LILEDDEEIVWGALRRGKRGQRLNSVWFPERVR
jgi:hypothetical protein